MLDLISIVLREILIIKVSLKCLSYVAPIQDTTRQRYTDMQTPKNLGY